MRRACLLRPVALVLSFVLLLFSQTLRAQDAAIPAPPLFQHVMLIGASVSAGFCTDEFLGGRRTPEFRLANYLDEALPGDCQPVVSRASKTLFLSARGSLEKQISETIAAKPSLVLGLDSLFWFCYGSKMAPEQRLELFEFGLKQLDRLDMPLVVGDLPDARHAAGGILSPDEVAEPEVLAKCNERLKTWAADKPKVILFPFSAMMKAAVAGDELTLAGHHWEKGQTRKLLQHDLLHPSPLGLATITVAALDSAAATLSPAPPAGTYRKDLEAIATDAVRVGAKQSQEEAARRAKPEVPAEAPSH